MADPTLGTSQYPWPLVQRSSFGFGVLRTGLCRTWNKAPVINVMSVIWTILPFHGDSKSPFLYMPWYMIGGYRKCSTPSWKIYTCYVSPLIAHVYFSITQKRIDTLLSWGKSKVLATLSCLFLIHYCVGATGSCWVCGLVLSSSYCLCRHLHALKFSSNWNKNFTQRSQELCHRDTVESTYEKIDEVDEKQTGQIIRLAKPSTEDSSTVCRLSATPLSFLLLAGNIVGLMLHCFDHMFSAVWNIWWNMKAVVVTVETDY